MQLTRFTDYSLRVLIHLGHHPEALATVAATEDELAAIRREAHDHSRTERVFHVELRDAAGVVHAAFEKTVVIKRRKAES